MQHAHRHLASHVVLYAVTACLATPSLADLDAPSLAGLWWRLDGEWRTAPPELGYQEEWARARFVRIHADGRLSLLACVIRRTKSGIGVSLGDGFVVFRGSWTTESGLRVARYVKAEETIPSSDPPFYSFQESPIVARANELQLGEDRFVRSDGVSVQEYDEIVQPVRMVADGPN